MMYNTSPDLLSTGPKSVRMMATSRPLGNQASAPAKDRVYTYVRDLILRGTLRGGSFIEEGHISAALGTSRTPVREALHRLEAERLIDLVPRRGAVVRQVTPRELVDVYEARKLIESYAVRRLCDERISLPAEMAALVERMRAGAGDDFARTELDRQFHRALVAASGNAVLVEMYDALRSRQQLVAVTAASVHPARLEATYDEHRDLLAALESREAERAVQAFVDHLRPMPEVLAGLDQP
jgi:DNA-binding GntR family transcriptional regulator